jgi:hypothetical protein
LLNREPSDRSFGLLTSVVFLAIGLQPLLHRGHVRNWALIGAGDLLILALIFPRSLRHARRAWLHLGMLLGRVSNPAVLAALFYLVVTPVACMMRLCRANPLRLDPDPALDSYWQERTESASRFEDQF